MCEYQRGVIDNLSYLFPWYLGHANIKDFFDPKVTYNHVLKITLSKYSSGFKGLVDSLRYTPEI